MKVNKKYDVELIAALLNSVITLLTIELRGTSRNLGVLDLNANYIKRLKILNPDLLSPGQIEKIKLSFLHLLKRNVKVIFDEKNLEDRRDFDNTVLQAFNIDNALLGNFYQILIDSVNDRVTMRDR